MHPVQTFELVIAMLLAILVLHWIGARLRLPPSVALLVGGGALAFIPGLPALEFDPELVLVLFLPPLLMDGAYFTALAEFRRHLVGVLSLAIGAVIFTTAIVGVVAHAVVPALPWAACFALGAIVSPPDAVSARAVLQRVKLPRRLTTLLEGESLLNDASGLVLFRFAVAATLTGTFNAVDAGMDFVLLALGGAVAGGAVGGIWILLLKKLRDDHLMIAGSMMVCWAAYLAGEMLHVSGVIATVAAGLVCGWYQHVVFTASVRMRASAFWAVMVFVLEAFVFILIGLSLRGVLVRVGGLETVFDRMALPVLAILAAMTVARFVWVFGSDGVLALLHRMGVTQRPPLGPRCVVVLGWAGMRGVVTLAVALTLPDAMPGRDLMLVVAFAAILITVLVQGMSLGAVIRAMGVRETEPALHRMKSSLAESAMANAQLRRIEQLAYDADGKLIHPRLLETYQMRARQTERYSADESQFAGDLIAHFTAILAAIEAGRHELVRLHRADQIDDETLHMLERDLDLEELGAIAAMQI